MKQTETKNCVCQELITLYCRYMSRIAGLFSLLYWLLLYVCNIVLYPRY